MRAAFSPLLSPLRLDINPSVSVTNLHACLPKPARLRIHHVSARSTASIPIGDPYVRLEADFACTDSALAEHSLLCTKCRDWRFARHREGRERQCDYQRIRDRTRCGEGF